MFMHLPPSGSIVALTLDRSNGLFITTVTNGCNHGPVLVLYLNFLPPVWGNHYFIEVGFVEEMVYGIEQGRAFVCMCVSFSF